MQSASSNFARAVTAGEVVWEKPGVYADWAVNGYGAVGSIDDLSDQVGRSIRIEHTLDDGYPDAVTYVEGVGVPTMEVPLVYGAMSSGADLTKASQYFSPFRTDSPVYPYQRDVAPVKVDLGAVTSAGVQSVRLFTGQMVQIPLGEQNANLQAMSRSRLRMSKAVQPPVLNRYAQVAAVLVIDYGLNATWPVTWAMHQCGVYPSPPAVSGARLWVPLHGGGAAFLPTTNNNRGIPTALAACMPNTANVDYRTVPGPYVGAAYAQVDPTLTRVVDFGVTTANDLYPGADFFSQLDSRGRVQFYVRGDAAAVNTIPGGSGQFVPFVGSPPIMAGVSITSGINPGTPYVACGVRLVDRLPFITVYDGVHTAYTLTGTVLPTDSAWHLIGAAWDVANSTTWLNVDGVVTSTVHAPAMSTSLLPANNYSGALDAATGNPLPYDNDFDLLLESLLPIAEFQFSTGAPASPTNVPAWQNTGWTQTATVYPSTLDLVALVEPVPREAWELVGSFAQNELASLRADENDNVLYLPLPWWALTAQQTTQETLSQVRHTAKTQITFDPAKIRNSITVAYKATTVDQYATTFYTLTSPIKIGLGVTAVLIPFTTPAVQVEVGYPQDRNNNKDRRFYVADSTEMAGTDFPAGSNPIVSYVAFNTAADGTGTYATSTDHYGDGTLYATLTAWTAGAALVTFTNNSGAVWYVASNSNTLAPLGIGGRAIHQVDASYYLPDAPSIAIRGERNLQTQLPAIQSPTAAASVAAALLGDLSTPIPEIVNAELFGDPRRQPGDLVAYSDAANTGVGGLWRYRSLVHTIDGASYTQVVHMRRGYLVGVWDTDNWGDVIWGE